jgi:hypothetical protein
VPIVPFWSWRFSASSCGRPRAWSCGAWIASAVRSSDGLRHVERVRAAGGTFYSVHDGLDTSTEAGRLVMKILLSVAEFQMEGVRSGWDVARERAIRRGVHINPWTPVGYRKTRAGRLRPHPRTAPIVAEVFRRRGDGASLLTLARCLESEAVLTGKGNRGWATGALSHMLRSRVYLGEVRSGPFVNEHAHDPLTDPATWEAAQAPRLMRRHETLPALLVGMARCAGCSHALQPFIARPPGVTPYRRGRVHAPLERGRRGAPPSRRRAAGGRRRSHAWRPAAQRRPRQ